MSSKLQTLANAFRDVTNPPYFRGADFCRDIRRAALAIAESNDDDSYNDLSAILAVACPIPDADNPALMSAYVTPDHARAMRRTIGKPAKILGKLFPSVTEKQKETFATWWREHFVLSRQGFVVKSTQDASEIGRVYTGAQAKGADPNLRANGWKSLAASCMRVAFPGFPMHPASIYGSGDFTLYWVENAAGEIAARVIVATGGGRFVPGPIYTNSNAAGRMLGAHIASLDHGEGTWIGCRLLRVEHHGEIVAPYLDQYNSAQDLGDELRISRDGGLALDRVNGFARKESAYTCEDCGCDLSEEEIFINDNGNIFCDSCYGDGYSHCDHCHSTIPFEDMRPIRDATGPRERVVDEACHACIGDGTANAIEVGLHEYYTLDSVVFDSDGNPHVVDSDTYFVSDLTGEVHDSDLEHTLPNGEACTIEEALDTGNWTLVIDKIPTGTRRLYDGTLVESFERIQRLVLKPWLELDISGEVVNRQPELLDIGLPGEAFAA